MKKTESIPLILKLDDSEATLDKVGGKGASLARLAAAGLPVPSGFYLTTAAYQSFVAENGLQEQILAAVAAAAPDQPASLETAARQIGAFFAQGTLPDDITEAIRAAYIGLNGGNCPVAVRSSATAEDLPGLSFAGQQETYLNMQGEAQVLDAVKRCWASLWTARAIGYRAQHRIAPQEVSLAVVVQELVPAEAAGVLFTVNPLTGAPDQAVINATWGLGEALVGGLVTPDTLVVEKAGGRIVEQQIHEKTVMTVRTTDGTHEIPVPPEQRTRAALSPAQAGELIQLGLRIEALYGQPMDIEWALHDGRIAILQARPITALHPSPLPLEEWNDSLTSDSLWTDGNLGEAIPDVMTPCAWSFIQIFMAGAMGGGSLPGYRVYGNIGGRFYLNLSLTATITEAFGLKKKFAETSEQAFGKLPQGLEIPTFPISRWRVFGAMLPGVISVLRRIPANQKKLPAYLAAAPERCAALQARIQAMTTPQELAEFWRAELAPYLDESSQMLEASARLKSNALINVRSELEKLVGEADTNAILTGLQSEGNYLASLGLLVGLTQLARGEIDRATFARQYGHRSPHEFEVSIARPGEDPDWIDRQLAGLRDSKESLATLLERQQHARAAAWNRLRQRYPKKEAALRRAVDQWAEVARAREAARSEVIRVFWVLRTFALRAGTLSNLGEDIFFLPIEEILEVLQGNKAPLAKIPVRRGTYARYCALPPYPTLIRGHFDPFQWAVDPNRRQDLFDATQAPIPVRDAITGFPGAAGIVEGYVRVISTPEEGDALQSGEILVTNVTNVGWTPLFPRAAAIVTDIGAPLSHASIVARELGIPAVVGCGNATTRLRTGDRVRVDGGKGTVERL